MSFGDSDLLVYTTTPLNYSSPNFCHQYNKVVMPSPTFSLCHTRKAQVVKAELHKSLIAVESSFEGINIRAFLSVKLDVIMLAIYIKSNFLILSMEGHRKVFNHIKIIPYQLTSIVTPVSNTHLLIHKIGECHQLLDINEDSCFAY